MIAPPPLSPPLSRPPCLPPALAATDDPLSAPLPWLPVGATPWALTARAAQAGFDAMRVQHAAAVRAGVIPPSLRGSARFEQWVDTLERATLGPLARRV